METFGQQMRLAIESRGLTPEVVAKATGLTREQLQALLCDDFAELPDDDHLREGLRSFARLVDVDQDQVIDDYRRQRQQSRSRGSMTVEPSRPRSGRMGWMAIVASASLALIVVVFHFWSRPSTRPESDRRPVVRSEAPKQEAAPREVAPEPREVAKAPPVESIQPQSAIEPSGDASRLSIRESGVGRGVINHELVDEASQFAEGERAWFWTRIEGGTAGESIEHVWLHEGNEALRVPLELGGAHWRTKSHKDLNPGSSGNWAVEARDEAGRVLARQEFLCTSPR